MTDYIYFYIESKKTVHWRVSITKDAFKSCAVISICNPKEAGIPFGSTTPVARFWFDDRSNKNHLGFGINRRLAIKFTPRMAKRILDFMEAQLASGIRHFVVKCSAGISRSAGVVAALEFIYNDRIEKPVAYAVGKHPNTFVKSIILREHRKEYYDYNERI